MTTPFSAIQVRAMLHRRPPDRRRDRAAERRRPAHGGAQRPRRADPARAALEAGSADVDVVSGATSTSKIWLDSLQGAIDRRAVA